jgi:hypothetical protein
VLIYPLSKLSISLLNNGIKLALPFIFLLRADIQGFDVLRHRLVYPRLKSLERLIEETLRDIIIQFPTQIIHRLMNGLFLLLKIPFGEHLIHVLTEELNLLRNIIITIPSA